MKSYVVKRVAWTFVVAYLALSATFFLLWLSPNVQEDEAAIQCAAAGEDPEECREQFREKKGLNQPVEVRYKNYMINMATLNWGWSDSRSQPVIEAIAEAWPYSAQYGIPVVLVSGALGYGIGIYSAYRQYSLADHLGAFATFVGISIPNFWFALVLIMILSVWLDIFPVYYQSLIPDNQGWLSWANIRQIVLPTVVLTSSSMAYQMLYTRQLMLEQMNQEFVKVAQAKGAGDYQTVIWHVLRVAAVPLATSIVSTLLSVLWTGGIIIEQIFAIPGIGLLTYQAILQQDTSLVLATTLIPVILAVLGNLFEDLAQIWLDPRIDYGSR